MPGDVGFVAPDAPINERIESIKFLLEQSAIANGLPASVVTSQAREMSGVALTVENAELSESRRDQIAIFAKAEQELFNLFRIVWNAHKLRLKKLTYSPQNFLRAAIPPQLQAWTQ